jgi:NADH-ubiquinone oxidoreductase chain 6
VHLVFSDQAADASFAYLSQVQALGLSLYTYGFLWLMLISFVLLLAMLGPIALCLRSRQYTA